MARRIVFPFDGGIAVLIPTGEMSVSDVARKDVPAGIPYRIIDSSELPPRDQREAWAFDFTSPDGHGIGPDAWFAEEAAKA